MKHFVRFTAIALVGVLSLACGPKSSHAGTTASTPTAKNCFFVKNNLPCPCPKAQQARVVAKATYVTAGALATAFRATGDALMRPNTPAAHASAKPAQPASSARPAKRLSD